MKYKNLQKKVLGTTFLSEKKSYKNPTDPTTFGNRYLNDKFSRAVNMENIKEIITKPNTLPAPGHTKTRSDFNPDKTDFAYKLPKIPREARNFDKILLKKDEYLIPSPDKHQTTTYLNGDLGSYFNVKKKYQNFSVPKSIRNYDPRIYAMENRNQFSKGLHP